MLLFANSIELKAQTSPNVVPANGNAGFGTSNPTEKVEINGKIKVTDKAIFKNDVVIDNDLKVKSLEDPSISVNRLLGINPNGKIIAPNGLFINNNGYKLDINGSFKAKEITTFRIKPLPGDSLIHFGDSSIVLQNPVLTNGFNAVGYHRIYATITSRYMTFGGLNESGLAIGLKATAKGQASYAIGHSVSTENAASRSIVIGTGYYKSEQIKDPGGIGGLNIVLLPLKNTFANSVMLGANSPLSSVFIQPGNEKKAGFVGINNTNPIATLDVNGGPLWTTNNWSKALKISRGNAFEMQGNDVKWGMGTANDDNWYLFHTKTEEQTDVAKNIMRADYDGDVTMYGNLNVLGNITGGGIASWLETGNISATNKFIGTTDWSPLIFKTNNQEKMRIADNGRIIMSSVLTVNDYVSIGTNSVNTAYKLGVCGVIGAHEVVVETGSWCDFVFDDNYKLPTLENRMEEILKQKHLPNMPTAKQVEAKGAEVGTTLKALLQNLEEAYLYMNELNKKVEALEKLNETTQKEIKELKANK